MSAQWPNEPSQVTVLNDYGHDAIVGGGWTDVYDTTGRNTTIVSDSTAPRSPNNVLRQRFPQGLRGGGGGGGGNFLQLPSSYPDLYLGFWFKVGAGFEQHPVATKIAWIHTPGNNYFLTFLGSGPYTINANWQWADNDPNNSHLGFVGSGFLSSSRTFNNNQWVQIEWYYRPSTTQTSRDGRFSLWMDGQPAASTSQLNTRQIYPSAVSYISIWGGVGSVMTHDNYTYYDHSHISTTLGGQPPPPPQVVLSSLTPANASTSVAGTIQFTISMSGAMPTATSLFVTSSNPAVATVPASVTISQGSSTAVFSATGVATGSTTISTSYNGVTKGATLQVQSTGTTTGGTVFTYATQFSGTQGSNNWYYMEEPGTLMTYNGGAVRWEGTDTYGGLLQVIWDEGMHVGGLRGTKLRFVVPTAGSAHIVGNANDVDLGASGVSVTFRVQHNGFTLFTRVINPGDASGGGYDITETVGVGDTIDFVITSDRGFSANATTLDPVITLADVDTPPTPTPPPDPPATLVDLFAETTTPINNTTFTVTVRLSKIVTVATVVEISVGSTNILSAASSVTVPIGSNEQSLTVTCVGVGQSTLDAVLTATKRLTIAVQPIQTPPPPTTDPGDDEELPGEDVPITVQRVTASHDGALVELDRPAAAMAFKFDARPDWMLITTFSGGSSLAHTFTWPSGTTTICYRAQDLAGTWGPSRCAAIVPPQPPPPKPPVNKAVIDKAGIKWQLTGKKSPYELKRNGSTMDNTFGVTLRKSGDGYLEMLQPNGVWLRRNGDSWEFVA